MRQRLFVLGEEMVNTATCRFPENGKQPGQRLEPLVFSSLSVFSFPFYLLGSLLLFEVVAANRILS
jgi:hypothetical protein